MPKSYKVPDTSSYRFLEVSVHVRAGWEQRVTVQVNGSNLGTVTGNGDKELVTWKISPSGAKDVVVTCEHLTPGKPWEENEYAGPYLQFVAGVGSLRLLSYDQPGTPHNWSNATVYFTWWGLHRPNGDGPLDDEVELEQIDANTIDLAQ